MTARLVRAEAGDFTGLWEDMLKAHEARLLLEVTAKGQGQTHDPSAERRRRVKRAQSLGNKAQYGKADKSLAHQSSLDPAAPAFQSKLRALHPTPTEPVPTIPDRDLPPAPTIYEGSVKAAIMDMEKDYAAGPYRAGVR